MSATTAYQEYGVLPSVLHSELLNDWRVKHLEVLENYYLLYWEPTHFFDEETNGIISHRGKDYIVIYHSCTRQRIKSVRQLALSFRAAFNDYNLPNYVLVSKQS